MKATIFTTSICILFLFGCNEKTNRQWQISGHLYPPKKKQEDSPYKAYLFSRKVSREEIFDLSEVVDSTVVKNGEFKFSGFADNSFGVQDFYIYTNAHHSFLPNYVFVENGKQTRIIIDSLNNASYSGSPNQIFLNKYQAYKRAYSEIIHKIWKIDTATSDEEEHKMQLKALNSRNKKLFSDFLKVIKTSKSPWLEAIVSTMTIATDTDKQQLKELYNNLSYDAKNTKDGKFIKALAYYGDVYDLLNAYRSNIISIGELKSVYDTISGEAKNSIFGLKIKEMIDKDKSVGVGQTPPEIVATTISGEDFKLSELQSPLILIDFWASWCKPCRIKNPEYVALNNEYQDKGLAILGYSLDDDKDKWKQAVKEDNLTWINVSTEFDAENTKNKAQSDYMVNAIPSNFLIKDNKIIAKNIFGQDLKKTIEKNLPPENK